VSAPGRRCAAAALRVALAFLAATSALAAPSAEVYRARHRSAEELLPYAEAALGGDGRAVVDPGSNALVLMSEHPERLREALALLAAQDRALRTVVLEYASRRSSELAAEGLRVDWGVATGALRIGNLRVPPGETRVRVAPHAAAGERSASLSGTVRILEGHAGRIATGQTASVTSREGRHRTTTLVSADSGLEARARVLGDGRVQLELRPFEADLRADGRIETADAATTLVVEPGRTVVIAGIDQGRAAASLDAYAGADSTRESDERVLTITARVE
jgi:hypothetical protein